MKTFNYSCVTTIGTFGVNAFGKFFLAPPKGKPEVIAKDKEKELFKAMSPTQLSNLLILQEKVLKEQSGSWERKQSCGHHQVLQNR